MNGLNWHTARLLGGPDGQVADEPLGDHAPTRSGVEWAHPRRINAQSKIAAESCRSSVENAPSLGAESSARRCGTADAVSPSAPPQAVTGDRRENLLSL